MTYSSHQSNLLRYFAYGHLPEGPLRETSRQFADLAVVMSLQLPQGVEKEVALRKLLEAKDAAVRATLDLLDEPEVDA